MYVNKISHDWGGVCAYRVNNEIQYRRNYPYVENTRPQDISVNRMVK